MAPDPRAARARRILLALAALAVLVRLLYLREYVRLPFLDAPLFDSAVYLRQAEAIRAGELGDPTLLAFSPLYGYFLAAVGDAAVPLQLLLGVVTMLLLFRVTARVASPEAALVACGLYLGHGLFPFYETKILSETVGFALLAIAFERFTAPAAARGHPGASLAAGALLGVATLARANLIFALPVFVVAALLQWGSSAPPLAHRARVARAAAVAFGIALVLGANGLHNLARTGHFVPVIFAARTVTSTTSADFDGTLDSPSGDGSAAGPWDVVREAEARLAGSEAPALPAIDLHGLLRGAPRKLAMALGDAETTFDYGYYGERTEMRVLGALPVSFGMLGLLSLLGAIALGRSRGLAALAPYVPLVLGVLATSALYHWSSRYRLPMVLPMLVLAACGVDAIARLSNRRARLAAVLVVTLVCAYFAHRTLGYRLRHPGLWELRVAEGEAVRGDVEAARARIARAMERDPASHAVRERAEYVEAMLPPPRP